MLYPYYLKNEKIGGTFYWFSEYTISNSFISICTSGDDFKRASNFCLWVNTCSLAIASSMIYCTSIFEFDRWFFKALSKLMRKSAFNFEYASFDGTLIRILNESISSNLHVLIRPASCERCWSLHSLYILIRAVSRLPFVTSRSTLCSFTVTTKFCCCSSLHPRME